MSEFGYAQARIQARYGERPTEVIWLQLGAAQFFQSYLEAARSTTLGPWVANLSGASDVHDVEHSMRGTFYILLNQLARWVPEPWADSVLWVRWLVYLPALRYLLEGGPIPDWMREGHRLRPYLQESPEARAEAIVLAGGEPLVRSWRRGDPLERAWLERWRELWPGADPDVLQALDGLAALLAQHAREFADTRPEAAWQARTGLQRRLEILFRRQAMQPAAVFSYLALVALDLERLRGELVSRAIFACGHEPRLQPGPALTEWSKHNRHS